MRKICWLTLLLAVLWCLAIGEEPMDELESMPPPEVRIEKPNAIYGHSFFRAYRKFKASPSQRLCEQLIKALERLLLEEPGGRFAREPLFGAPMYLFDNSGGPLGTLSELYQFQGRYNEAVAVEVQKALVMYHDAVLADSFAPVFPGPNLLNDLRSAIDFIKRTLERGIQVKPLVFVRGWPIRARWKGNSPDDALISLNDLAYALGHDQWRDIIHHDWKAWRFTLSLQDKTLSFSAGSPKGVVSGKEVQLRHPVERSFYDLYVPLGDLVRLVGGSLRPPKPGELEVFRRHLPVSLLVIELQ
jgi:hypothetical protein